MIGHGRAVLDAIGAATPGRGERAWRAFAIVSRCPRPRRIRRSHIDAPARDLDPVMPPVQSLTASSPRSIAIRRRTSSMPVTDSTAAADGRRRRFPRAVGREPLGPRHPRESNTAEAEVRRLAEQNQLLAARRGSCSAEMASLASADTRNRLTGQQVSPSASAKVFLSNRSTAPRRRLLLQLPQRCRKSYQLWSAN